MLTSLDAARRKQQPRQKLEPLGWELVRAPTFLILFLAVLIQHPLAAPKNLLAELIWSARTDENILSRIRRLAGERLPLAVPHYPQLDALSPTLGNETHVTAG